MEKTKHRNYCCPICKSALIEHEEFLSCIHCSSEFKVIGGIPSFATHEFYWNQFSKETMRELLADAEKDGWSYALKKHLTNIDPYIYKYITDESRGKWQYLLPIDTTSTILDIGSGWGAVTMSLARRYRAVYAADATFETLHFLKIRAEQEKTDNLKLAHIDPLDYAKLPYPDSFFDLVVLNGVLEYVGACRTDLSPSECQKNALKEIVRVLKPKGLLYIGIENRFGIHYFIGYVDHSGLRFTSLFPRKIADLICKARGKKEGYRTYTYSFLGYTSLLRSLGFPNIEFYFLFPNYQIPDRIFVESDREIKVLFSKNLGRSKLSRFLLNAYVHFRPSIFDRYLHPFYGIVARCQKE